METAQASIDKCMANEVAIHAHTRTHNEILLGPKKGIPAIRDNMDGSRGCYVK